MHKITIKIRDDIYQLTQHMAERDARDVSSLLLSLLYRYLEQQGLITFAPPPAISVATAAKEADVRNANTG